MAFEVGRIEAVRQFFLRVGHHHRVHAAAGAVLADADQAPGGLLAEIGGKVHDHQR